MADSRAEMAVGVDLGGTKIQTAICNRDNNLSPHYLPLHVRICIVFSNIVAVLRKRCMGRQFFHIGYNLYSVLFRKTKKTYWKLVLTYLTKMVS